ncbi:MAG: hypothetical protein ACRCTA_03475, partial [Bacilli bacterium]
MSFLGNSKKHMSRLKLFNLCEYDISLHHANKLFQHEFTIEELLEDNFDLFVSKLNLKADAFYHKIKDAINQGCFDSNYLSIHVLRLGGLSEVIIKQLYDVNIPLVQVLFMDDINDYIKYGIKPNSAVKIIESCEFLNSFKIAYLKNASITEYQGCMYLKRYVTTQVTNKLYQVNRIYLNQMMKTALDLKLNSLLLRNCLDELVALDKITFNELYFEISPPYYTKDILLEKIT